MDLFDKTIREAGYAKAMRTTWDPRWQSLAEYELPAMANFTRIVTPGQAKGSKIYHSEGKLAARECATRINGFLTGDGTNWFDLTVPDDKIAQDRAVQGWLDVVKRVAYFVFNTPQSGFGTAKEPTYQQVVVFGNAPLYIGEDQRGWPIFRPAFLGNCSIWTDENNVPVALFREYQNTAWGLRKQFGEEQLPRSVRAVLATEPQCKFTCIHAVRPREDDDPFDMAGKPWIEVYLVKDGEHQLLADPTGYWEFPWLFPRWSVAPDEPYGRGPGDDALDDVRMLQRIENDLVKAVELQVDPPWLVDDESGVTPRINQNPGSNIYGRMNAQGHFNMMPVVQTSRVDLGQTERAEKIRTIKALFYLDAFKSMDKVTERGSVVNMSATEWAGRNAEQMRYAGPALERLRAEFLFPMLSRVLRILVRNGKVPPPPWQLRGAPIHPQYVSPLAMAQRSSERSAALQLIGDIVQLAPIDPRAIDVINSQRTGLILQRAAHAPVEMLNTPEELAAITRARSDAAQSQAAAQQVATSAGAAKDNAQAVTLLQQGRLQQGL
jgi:hypothetical protein